MYTLTHAALLKSFQIISSASLYNLESTASINLCVHLLCKYEKEVRERKIPATTEMCPSVPLLDICPTCF